MSDAIDLSIIIPTHQRPRDLEVLLRSISDQDLERDRFEVIVVSNLCDKGLEGRLSDLRVKEFLNIHYFEVGQIGGNLARNLGLKRSKGSVVYFLDDDCELPKRDCLRHLLDQHQIFPDAVGIGGKYDLPPKYSVVDEVYKTIQDNWLDGGIVGGSLTQYLIGGNVSFKKSFVGSDLYFDDKIDFGGAETELMLRLFRKGYELRYVDSLKVIHHANVSIRDLAYKAVKQGIGYGNRRKSGLVGEKTGVQRTGLEVVLTVYERLNLRGLTLFVLVEFFDYFFSVGVQVSSSGERPKIDNEFLIRYGVKFALWKKIIQLGGQYLRELYASLKHLPGLRPFR